MSSLRIWVEDVSIPTYGVGEPNRNPMFLEKRVYQGSSGKVYPYPVIDRIEDVRAEKTYRIVFLENDYVQIQVMPELGGRIYRALDKTNGYDFVYYNRVIKPALVGLTGPWVSGGIEFNWPQHHRPTTFTPLESWVDDSADDVKTVWVTDRDRLYGTRVTTGISVRRDSAVVEIHSELYNPTGEPQSFLWWANPAVAVHDETQSIFPPDVHAVMDHGKRDVSRFPIATGVYYKMDYSAGVDISRYKSIPVPTSYMAYHSDYDFVGGYDWRAGAGVLHVADHHIAPGKKQWTWGSGEFGRAWDRNLTDADGPYIELMTGVYTDNQPDFTWLAPYQSKQFTQCFLPYKGVGVVKNANRDVVMGLEVEGGTATVRVYVTRPAEVRIELVGVRTYIDEVRSLTPAVACEIAVPVDEPATGLTCTVIGEGVAALTYTPAEAGLVRPPEPARPIGAPVTLPTCEALWLAGTHLEQYRHATYDPEPYYREGLTRDQGDLRLNLALGNLLVRRGEFGAARTLYERAVATATRHNPNPADGEPYYGLGKALEWLGETDAAYDAYYKATWSDAGKSAAYLKLGQIAARRGDLAQAARHLTESLYAGYKNMTTRGALAVVHRLLGHTEAARALVAETLTFDPMEPVARYEVAGRRTAVEQASIASGVETPTHELAADPHAAIGLAVFYRTLGQYATAADVLEDAMRDSTYAMLAYYLAETHNRMGDAGGWAAAAAGDRALCFPNSLEDYAVLTNALRANPADATAHYLLGCWLYDKRRVGDAQAEWEAGAALDPAYPTVHRNLALLYANKTHDYVRARTALERAFALDETDARVFYELTELCNRTGVPPAEQRAAMEAHRDLVDARDDLTVAYAQVLNLLGEFEAVIDLLSTRRFHPWEGGEGKVPTAHVEARIGLARRLMGEGRDAEAIGHLEAATVYAENFGEGKLTGAQENNVYYYLGLACRNSDPARARECFERAATGLAQPAGALYYNDQPPHMIYYQGLALRELGREAEARGRFNTLVAYGEAHVDTPQVMDFFAVSLPDFLVFDRDLDEMNNVHCWYMMGLGYLGLGDAVRAGAACEAGLRLAPNHYGLRTLAADVRGG